MSDQDEEYYRRRAEEERRAAADASQANVAMVHEELARLYEALADQPELRPAGMVDGREAGGSPWASSDAAEPSAGAN